MTQPRKGPNADAAGKINTASILWVFRVQPAAGLPIQAEGIIPTIGKAQLKLNEVKWRPKSE